MPLQPRPLIRWANQERRSICGQKTGTAAVQPASARRMPLADAPKAVQTHRAGAPEPRLQAESTAALPGRVLHDPSTYHLRRCKRMVMVERCYCIRLLHLPDFDLTGNCSDYARICAGEHRISVAIPGNSPPIPPIPRCPPKTVHSARLVQPSIFQPRPVGMCHSSEGL